MHAPLKLRKRIDSNKPVWGTFIVELFAPGVPRILANCGMDFITIDGEHGSYDPDQIRRLIEGSNDELACFVRVSSTSDGLITSALDAGAHGIMFPQIRTIEQVKKAVQMTKYPPLGNRGVHMFRPHTKFQSPKDNKTYFNLANKSLLTIVQIETLEALEIADQIAATDGVDVLYFGAGDMGASIGISNGDRPDKMKKMMTYIGQVAIKNNKIAGCHISDTAEAVELSKKGYRMFGHAAASRLLMNGVEDFLSKAKKAFLRTYEPTEGLLTKKPLTENRRHT
jgi:4-hydroxy-2-oxoheptanedioate aldolase